MNLSVGKLCGKGGGGTNKGNTLFVDVSQVLLVQHIIQSGDLAGRVGDDGKLERDRVDFVDTVVILLEFDFRF